jgi:hemerythrin-like metal-binding protein
MPLLQWKPSYSLGIPSIDAEHREMINTINSVYATLQDEHHAKEVDGVLGEIHAQISAHFALEERLMRATGYTEYAGHKGSHEELLDQIRDLMDAFSADPAAGRARLQNSLSNWFGEHFATFDARLHKHL